MNIAAITSAIYGWVAGTAPGGTTVYWNEPNGPRPKAPAVRLKLIGGMNVRGIDEVVDKDGSATDFEIRGQRTMTLSVSAYGDTAQQIVSDLMTSLSDPNVQDALDLAGGLSTLSTSPVRDVSQFLDTKYEQRFQFDINLLAAEQKTVQPGLIEEIQGSGDVAGVTIPISVP